MGPPNEVRPELEKHSENFPHRAGVDWLCLLNITCAHNRPANAKAHLPLWSASGVAVR